MPKLAKRYDVVILGANISGGMLASILAKEGVSVLVLDPKEHPRFCIGESMVPESATLLKMMARCYDMNELATCAHPTNIREQIGSSCGVKLNFGYVFNEEGKLPRPDEATMTPIFPPEAHLYRQDTDSFHFHTAAKYGAHLREKAVVATTRFESSGATLTLTDGTEVEAGFVVDGYGPRSPVGEMLQIREDAPAMRTHSASIFTHMIDVPPFEESVFPQSTHGFPVRFSQGTLHHFFDTGWLWIIPFDNHPYRVSRLCSVGLQWDPRRVDLAAGAPEERFMRFVERYPGMYRQIKDARAVREWTFMPRLQYTARTITAPRYCASANTAGFVDPLFSRGLVITFETVLHLSHLLIAAVRENDFREERFAALDHLVRSYVDVNDRLVACSYIAFRDFTLWNAWYRLWSAGVFFGGNRLQQLLARWDVDGKDVVLSTLLRRESTGSLARGLPAFDQLFDAAATVVESVERGERKPAAAAEEIFRLLSAAERFLPPFDYSKPEQRYPFAPTAETASKIMTWGRERAPAEVRSFCFDRPVTSAAPDTGAEYRLP